MRIRVVLCPIDFSSLDQSEVGIACEVARTFDAMLVLHHDLAAAEPGFSRAWEWTKAHHDEVAREREATRALQALLDRVGGGVRAQAVMTTGPLAESVLALAARLTADLIVLGSHGWSSQDHASVAERVVEHAPCAVLTFRERGGEPAFRLHPIADEAPARVVVPVDLSPGSEAALEVACAFARDLDVRVELLHVVAASTGEISVAEAQAQLAALVPPDLRDRVSAHLRRGEPAEEIARYLDATAPAFAMVGGHARALVRRLFTRDTTRALVRRARCPVWVVPAAA